MIKDHIHLSVVLVPTQRGEWISGSCGAQQSQHRSCVNHRSFLVTGDTKFRRWIYRKTNINSYNRYNLLDKTRYHSILQDVTRHSNYPTKRIAEDVSR